MVMTHLKTIIQWMVLRKDLIKVLLPVLLIFFFVTIASAQISTGIPPLSNATGATNLLCRILNFMFWGLISISIIMILWGAYLYVTAGQDAKKPSEARMTILYALIGIVVALSAKGFPLVVASVFPGASVSSCSGSANSSSVKYGNIVP
jgi:hypothetical protein